MERFEITVKNGIILTMDNEMRTLNGGNIGLSGAEIKYVGKNEIRLEEEINTGRCIIAPGFVNCHTHFANDAIQECL